MNEHMRRSECECTSDCKKAERHVHVGIQHILCDQMSECECAFEVSEKEKRGERERF